MLYTAGMNPHLFPRQLEPDRVVARIGLISDTHMPGRWPSLPPVIFELFQGVDLILHAGDIGEPAVLDRLSVVAPVVAVHGNDESEAAQRELPYQQLLAAGGHRLLLCHGHLPDREAEVASRAGDEWRPKLAQRAAQARRAGARTMVFGHLHIPFVTRCDNVWLINPGAIASGGVFMRQTRRTVALLYLRNDGRPFVVHVDLARPEEPYDATVDWEAGFAAALARYSMLFVDSPVIAFVAALWRSRFRNDRRPWKALERAAMPCYTGQQERLTREEALAALATADEFSPMERAELLALFGDVVA